jgi:hypothetical protein
MFAHSWAIKGWVIKQVMDFDAYSSAQLQAIERMVPFTRTAR